MEFNVDFETTFQLIFAILIGAIIGAEREYRTKTAGLRTMIMIALGSTIFTQLSATLGPSAPERIASNIVTGIGFLGAGVIFKDGLSVSGITTATTIWITAALGMAVGAGEYFIAAGATGVVMMVLSVFEVFTKKIAELHQERMYKITFVQDTDFEQVLYNRIHALHLNYKKEREFKTPDHFTIIFHIRGKEKHLEIFNDFLKDSNLVIAYEY